MINGNRKGGGGSPNRSFANAGAGPREAGAAKRRRQPAPRRSERVGEANQGQRYHNWRGRRLSSFRDADQVGPGEAKRQSGEERRSSYRYLVFWKPFGVAVRFAAPGDDRLAEDKRLEYYIKVPKVLPIGQLDSDTEGLMFLTDDPRFRFALGHPRCQEMRLFLTQVEGDPSEEALNCLRTGVSLNDVTALPVEVDVVPVPNLPSRPIPVRERLKVADTWMEICASQGWSKHIRRLTSSVGYPTLRLVLWAMGPVNLTTMVPGMCRDFTVEEKHWAEEVSEKAPEPRRASYLRRRKHLPPGREARAVSGSPKRGPVRSHWACRVDRQEVDKRQGSQATSEAYPAKKRFAGEDKPNGRGDRRGQGWSSGNAGPKSPRGGPRSGGPRPGPSRPGASRPGSPSGPERRSPDFGGPKKGPSRPPLTRKPGWAVPKKRRGNR